MRVRIEVCLARDALYMLCVGTCREECLPLLIPGPNISLVWQSGAFAVRPFVKDFIMRALLVVICLQTVAARSGPDAVATLPVDAEISKRVEPWRHAADGPHAGHQCTLRLCGEGRQTQGVRVWRVWLWCCSMGENLAMCF